MDRYVITASLKEIRFGMPEIISEIGDMEHKHLNSSVHRVVSLIKVLNQNPQFQHLNS